MINEKGTWEKHNSFNLLVNPSEDYKQELEQQAILDSLIPSQSEIEKAERELETITLLQDLGVI